MWFPCPCSMTEPYRRLCREEGRGGPAGPEPRYSLDTVCGVGLTPQVLSAASTESACVRPTGGPRRRGPGRGLLRTSTLPSGWGRRNHRGQPRSPVAGGKGTSPYPHGHVDVRVVLRRVPLPKLCCGPFVLSRNLCPCDASTRQTAAGARGSPRPSVACVCRERVFTPSARGVGVRWGGVMDTAPGAARLTVQGPRSPRSPRARGRALALSASTSPRERTAGTVKVKGTATDRDVWKLGRNAGQCTGRVMTDAGHHILT